MAGVTARMLCEVASRVNNVLKGEGFSNNKKEVHFAQLMFVRNSRRSPHVRG
ncbi:hypothetical protein ACCAA_600010 [Candidatus Accumulibacter aalborgensis]|uniref:Uncharacterized protein n=1 Tax=Candidatus Accumulibacter aalborgensis TaxID=1860102 RepID=A0A1A8XUA8_9PROT|nr:hypothetical protein ACCAA_600010 [Candidatus Accumulibacter aalborgensis]